MISLVEKSYESLRVTALASLLGLSNQDSVLALASERSWPVLHGFAFPSKRSSSSSAMTMAATHRNDNADALGRLTEYVAHLEE